MALVEEVFDPLAWPEREMMLLAKGAHGVDGLTPAFLFFRAQNRLTGDGFESTFHNFFGRAADAAGERGFEKFLAVGRKIDLHEKEDTTLLPSDNRHYRTEFSEKLNQQAEHLFQPYIQLPTSREIVFGTGIALRRWRRKRESGTFRASSSKGKPPT
jgi:hypothetical protein